MKYIDANRLLEMISEQMKSLPREVGRGAGTITPKGYGMMQAFQIMRSIINSLQQEQPEVDLEEEIQRYLCEECSSDDEPTITEIATHFYELGFNTKKEK